MKSKIYKALTKKLLRRPEIGLKRKHF